MCCLQADELEAMLAGPGPAAATTQLEDVPFVLLVFDEQHKFAEELQNGCCRNVLQLAAQHHPGCSLGIWVHNFAQWCNTQEARNGRACRTDFSAVRMKKLMAKLTLTCPAVQLKDVGAAAAWVLLLPALPALLVLQVPLPLHQPCLCSSLPAWSAVLGSRAAACQRQRQ